MTTFLRKLSLVRLFFESICLVIYLMFLTAHTAFLDTYGFVINSYHTGMENQVMHKSPAIAVGWLFLYFFIPRTIVGWIGMLRRHTFVLTVHAILTAIILVMYCVVGLVCMIVEDPVTMILNFMCIFIEATSLIISYKLIWEFGKIQNNNSFDWKSLITSTDVPDTV